MLPDLPKKPKPLTQNKNPRSSLSAGSGVENITCNIHLSQDYLSEYAFSIVLDFDEIDSRGQAGEVNCF